LYFRFKILGINLILINYKELEEILFSFETLIKSKIFMVGNPVTGIHGSCSELSSCF